MIPRMKRMYGRAGATLVDVVASLAILAIALTMGAPRLGAARDVWAADTARDAAIALITSARTEAIAHGSARVVVDPVRSELRVEAPAGVPRGDVLLTRESWGVVVTVDHANTIVFIDFDGLGLGRLANRTLRFRRGGAESRVSLSTYGRPRRW